VIISHKHRFIHVKCAKVGATSLEFGLSSLCGPDDIITPRWEVGGNRAQNCYYPLYPPNRPPTRADTRWVPHTEPPEIMAEFPKEWEDYYTFVTERNPWDRIISHYYGAYYQHHDDVDRPTLSECLDQGLLGVRVTNRRFYTDSDDNIIVDHVMRYENYDAELAALCDRLGVEVPTLPRLHAKFRRDRRHPSEVLTQADADIVSRDSASIIREFGYTLHDGVAR
jgi:hypothetical protein